MDDMHKFGVIVVPITWAVMAVVSIIMYFCAPDNWMISYILGGLTSLLNFGLMMKCARKLEKYAKESEGNNPKKMFFGGFGIRLLVFIGVFLAIWYSEFKTPSPKFYCIPAFIGYLTLKFVIIIYGIIMKGRVIRSDGVS